MVERRYTQINMTKKGLSDIVATVLIILLALAAIAIVWAVVQNMIQGSSTTTELTQMCLLTKVEPANCKVVDGINNATVSVVLQSGDQASIREVIAIIEDDANGRVTLAGATPSAALAASQIGPIDTSSLAPITTTANMYATAAAKVFIGDEEMTCTPSLTKVTCQNVAHVCGDSKRQGTEECDDGNVVIGDGCSATCTNE